MPAAVAVPLITAAATGATSIVGAKMASNSARRAGDIQSRYNDQALAAEREQLAYERDQFGNERDYRRRLNQQAMDDWRAWQGSPEMGRLNELLGVPAGASPFQTPEPLPRSTVPVNELRSAGSGATPAAQLVTLKAPTGETRQFAAGDPKVQRYLQRGARRVS